jgi:hypothetical protein
MAGPDVGQKRFDCRIDKTHVSGVAIRKLRSTHGYEMDPCVLHFLQARTEAKPPVPSRQKLFETWLEEWRLASGKHGDLGFVDIDADHIVPKFGHARSVYSPQIPTPND